MAIVNANGVGLHISSSGDGQPALIFSHGLLMDSEMYASQVEAFKDRHRCVVWDQRGHGQTRESGASFSYWDSARDVIEIMDALEIERALLIGLSQGGFLSMRAALLAPERVAGLVLVATQSGVDPEEVYDNFRGLKAEWSANGSANAGPGVASMLIGNTELEQPWLEKWSKEPPSRLGPCIDTLIARDDITGRLNEIQCPSLVIHGDADGAIPVALGRALADALPNCRGFVSVRGAAHAPNITHPEIVNQVIADFLASL